MEKKDSKNKINLKIFIASPSDLTTERIFFREVIEEINSESIFSDYNLESVGWENTLIGKGRPQKLINKDLEQADLVVFVLWKRWGSDSGKYSSGFEEEFDLANELDKNIWLFFKDIPTCMLEDPGPQLSEVLKFKEQIISEKKYLFKEYKTESEWKKIFREYLLKYLNRNNLECKNDSLKINKRILTNFNKHCQKNIFFSPYITSVQIALDSINRFMKMGNYKEVEAIYQNVLNNTSQENPLILFHYCGFLVEQGQFNKALKYVNILLKWLEKYDIKNSTINLRAELYWTLGSLYYEYSCDYDSSINNYKIAIELFEKDKNYEKALYCCKLMVAPLQENNIDNSFNKRLLVLKKAYKYSKKSKLYADEVEILCALSVIYKDINRKLFNKCIDKADNLIKEHKIKKQRPIEYVAKNLSI